jgi:flagellar biosynthesis regulator FlaF
MKKQSHSLICVVALIRCCIATAEARTREEIDRADFETKVWTYARKALEN